MSNALSGPVRRLAALFTGALVALLMSSTAHAFAIYRVDFTAVIDSGDYLDDDVIAPGSDCPVSDLFSSYCNWTDIVGTTAYGHWFFNAEEYGDPFADTCCGYDVVIPALYSGSFYPLGLAGGQQLIKMSEAYGWSATRSVDDFGNRRISGVTIASGAPLGEVPDLATTSSIFEFSIQGGFFTTEEQDRALLCPGFMGDIEGGSIYGSCRGQGHLTSISVRQVGLVDEPATLALVGATVLGLGVTRMRRRRSASTAVL